MSIMLVGLIGYRPKKQFIPSFTQFLYENAVHNAYYKGGDKVRLTITIIFLHTFISQLKIKIEECLVEISVVI